MTRINAADQILALLRAQLERRDKQRRKSNAGAERAGRDQAARSAIERLREITSNSEIPESEVERALIQALLLDEFGDAAINDPQFQTLIETVHKHLATEETSRNLIRRAANALVSL